MGGVVGEVEDKAISDSHQVEVEFEAKLGNKSRYYFDNIKQVKKSYHLELFDPIIKMFQF